MSVQESERRKRSPGTPEVDSKSSNHEAPLECDWSEHISSSGKPYYFNRKSNSSQWQMPSEFAKYRAEKERRQKQKAAAAAHDRRKATDHRDHRSRFQQQNSSGSASSSQAQDVSPPTVERSISQPSSSAASRTHRSSTASSTHPDVKARSVSSRTDSTSAVPHTPVTPSVRPAFVQQSSTDNGKTAEGNASMLQPALTPQPALHPLQQATLLLQSEQSRQAAAVGRGSLPNHSVPSPKLACLEYQRMYCDEHGRPKRPRPDCLVQPSGIPPAPQLEDSLVADFSPAAIAHLQGWASETLENEATRAHNKWRTLSFCQEPLLREQIHQTESLCRTMAVASEVSAGNVHSIQGHVGHLEKKLGIDSNPS